MNRLLILLLIPFVLSCSKKEGCTDASAMNFDSSAKKDDGSCEYCVYGCKDILAYNYSSNVTCDDESCSYIPIDVYISSVVATPTASESVTLTNNIGSTIDISDWTLGDQNAPTSYNIPGSTTLLQGASVTFSSSQLTFQINDSGEILYLKDGTGATRHTWSN